MRAEGIIIKMLKKIQRDLNKLKKKPLKIVKRNKKIVLPIDSKSSLMAFENALGCQDTFNNYIAHFKNQLKHVSLAKTIYNRRKKLKELMFSE